jgi:glutaredoxin
MGYVEISGMDGVEFTWNAGTGPYSGDDPAATLIVGLTDCHVCHKVVKVLKNRGIAFGYADLDALPHSVRGPFLRGLKSLLPPQGLLTPVLITDKGAFIAGYNAERWAEAGLDIGADMAGL